MHVCDREVKEEARREKTEDKQETREENNMTISSVHVVDVCGSV